jgi:hypothetical protein
MPVGLLSVRGFQQSLMLIPLTRKKFEELMPRVGTGDQYRYCWGKPRDFLRRLLVSIVAVVIVVILQVALGKGFEIVTFIAGITAGLYWLWSPVYLASRRNAECRKYEYSGFWQGQVLEVFITEELIGKEETVNNRGDLVIVENRERCLNLEIGDESGFSTKIQVPLQREHRVIRAGDVAEAIVLSNRPDLSRISKVSDIFLSDYNLWVSDYPYVRRDSFVYVSRQLRRRQSQDQ